MAIDGKVDFAPLEQLQNLQNDMGKRMEKYGIPRESVTSLSATAAFLTLQQKYLHILTVCKNMMEATSEYMDDLGRELSYEAESKVTGLSYGILTSSALDMIAYSIDDFRARQRQRNAAYAEADRIFHEKGKQAWQLATDSFKAFAQKLVPSFEAATSEYISALIKDELEVLDREGFIQQDIIEKYDISKSVSIIDQATKNSHIDKAKALSSALREYPNNKGAFAFARDNGLFNEDVAALEAFFKVIEDAKAKSEAEAKAKVEAEARAKAEAEAEARAKAEAAARTKAEEEKRRQEERLAAARDRYDELSTEIRKQKEIIEQNSSWFGAAAKIRKTAQEVLRSVENQRLKEFPNGRP